MEIDKQQLEAAVCGQHGLLAIRDTMELLSGKWKIQIIGCIGMHGALRFMELRRLVAGIAAKMLSKELQELQQNKLVTRKVTESHALIVEYDLTEHGRSLLKLIGEIRSWGVGHRKFLFGKE